MKTLKKLNNQNNQRNYKKDTVSKYLKGTLAIGIGVLGLTGCGSKENQYLVLTKDTLNVELGQKVSTNIADYVDNTKVDSYKDLVKKTKETDNLKNEKSKNYPKVGNYEIKFKYKDEKATVKVVVKDTTKPKIIVSDSIDILQYTDLSTFDFDTLLKVEDFSKVGKFKIDTSKVDVNTIGTYDLKISIKDKYNNKTTKTIKVNIVEAPQVGEGEVAVTEIVKDENGNAKTVVTKKASSEVSNNDAVASTKPVENKKNVTTSSSNSVVKPSSTGTAKPSNSSSSSSSSNASNSSGNSNNSSSNNSSSSNTTSKPSNSSSGSNNSSSSSSSSSNGSSNSNNNIAKPSTPTHSHNYNIPITKVVHHDAVTHQENKVVKEAYDEPVYQTQYICNRCGFHTLNMHELVMHIGDQCGGGYHAGKVQIDTKHHDAVTETVTVTDKEAYDETVTIGYKCSCGATK